jgi:16S rRNA (guanine(527)-N(7))-methyltransferase RsmG
MLYKVNHLMSNELKLPPQQQLIFDTLQYVRTKLPIAMLHFVPTLKLCSQILHYWELLMRWNDTIRLTGASTLSQFAHRHLADALFGMEAIYDLSAESSILDIGTGAGFPAIPLALLRPDLQWTLAESHTRRAAFLAQLQRSLQLTNIRILAQHIDGNPCKERLKPDFQRVLFRAVAPEKVLPIADRYLSTDGQIVYWGTTEYQPPPLSSLRCFKNVPYALPHGQNFCLFFFCPSTSST